MGLVNLTMLPSLGVLVIDPGIYQAGIYAAGTVVVALIGLAGIIFGKVHESRHQTTVKKIEDSGEKLRKRKNLEIHQLKLTNKTQYERIKDLEEETTYLRTQLAESLRRRSE